MWLFSFWDCGQIAVITLKWLETQLFAGGFLFLFRKDFLEIHLPLAGLGFPLENERPVGMPALWQEAPPAALGGHVEESWPWCGELAAAGAGGSPAGGPLCQMSLGMAASSVIAGQEQEPQILPSGPGPGAVPLTSQSRCVLWNSCCPRCWRASTRGHRAGKSRIRLECFNFFKLKKKMAFV